MIGVAQFAEHAVVVVNVGDSAGHSGGEVAAGGADHHHSPAGHVFAAVIANAFHHSARAAVAHGESFAGHAVEIHLAFVAP